MNNISKQNFIQTDIVTTFPYILKEDCNIDNLHKGDIVTVDMEKTIDSDSIVLVKFKGSESLQLRKVKSINSDIIDTYDNKGNAEIIKKNLLLFAFAIIKSERIIN